MLVLSQTTDDAFLNKERTGFQSEPRVLKISSCVQLIVAGVSRVIESFKALEYLDVRSSLHVTRDSCERVPVQFPTGYKLNFYGILRI
jgi:F-box/leucine-rich repeat protein 2/20